MAIKRTTIPQIRTQKGKAPLVCLTSYTAPFTRIIDPHADIILVGDSLGMVVYGMDSTLGVTLDMMIAHGKAVVNASNHALIMVDMPFGTYEGSTETAFTNAARIIAETGAQAVKMEGGKEMADTVAFLTKRGIPVIGHIGLLPQHVHNMGGYRYQGKTQEHAAEILADAIMLEKSGASAIVLEGITESLAKKITDAISIPTIGIGASPACDGQILVTEDMCGLNGNNVPRFVKLYAHMADSLDQAVSAYADEVRQRSFPSKDQCFDIKLTKAQEQENTLYGKSK